MSTPNALMTVPEFVLQQTLESLLSFIRTDYQAAVTAGDETKSYIYKLYNGAGFQRYDFFEQAKAVFMLPEDDPRFLTVELMFNMERKGAPTIHVTLPSEQTGQGNGLGIDEGYVPDEIEDGDPDTHTPGTDTPIYTRAYQAIYSLAVTSDNPNEVILIFHTVKALLTAVTTHLHQYGIMNMQLGGQDIQPYSELARDLYIRAVTVSVLYETSVPSIYPLPIPNTFTVIGKPIDPFS